MDRGAWWAAVHGVTKSWTRLSMHAYKRPHSEMKNKIKIPTLEPRVMRTLILQKDASSGGCGMLSREERAGRAWHQLMEDFESRGEVRV